MPKYRVLTRSFINNAVVEEGVVVDYDGTPGPNLEPMDSAGEQAAAAAQGLAIGDIARQKVAALGGSPDAVDTSAAVSAAAAAAGVVLQTAQQASVTGSADLV